MFGRTSSKTMTFQKPFILAAYTGVFPAGSYDVETDEELLEGLSFPVYRRTSTVIRFKPATEGSGRVRAFTVDWLDLEAAFERDQVSEAEGTAALLSVSGGDARRPVAER